MRSKLVLAFVFSLMTFCLFSQTGSDSTFAENERKFSPYMATVHGGPKGLAEFKKSNREKYDKELWYYSSSFYIKRNYKEEGVPMNEAGFCISRYEEYRKVTEESFVVIPGYRDVLVLLPANKLLYKP